MLFRSKVLKSMGEKGKIAIRNIRREANEELKKKLKEKTISEDDNKNNEKNIQKLTDSNIETIDKIQHRLSVFKSQFRQRNIIQVGSHKSPKLGF